MVVIYLRNPRNLRMNSFYTPSAALVPLAWGQLLILNSSHIRGGVRRTEGCNSYRGTVCVLLHKNKNLCPSVYSVVNSFYTPSALRARPPCMGTVLILNSSHIRGGVRRTEGCKQNYLKKLSLCKGDERNETKWNEAEGV